MREEGSCTEMAHPNIRGSLSAADVRLLRVASGNSFSSISATVRFTVNPAGVRQWRGGWGPSGVTE